MPPRLPILATIGQAYRVFWSGLGGFLALLLLSVVASVLAALPIFAAKVSGAPREVVILIQVVVTVLQVACQVTFQMAGTVLTDRLLQGRFARLGEAVSLTARRLLALLGVNLLQALLVFLGTLLLIVPGIILALRYAVALPATLLEGRGVMASLGRSKELTFGHKWRILGMGLTIVGLFLAALVVVAILGGALLPKDVASIVIALAVFGLSLAVMPLGFTLPAVLFTRLRAIYEGQGRPVGASV